MSGGKYTLEGRGETYIAVGNLARAGVNFVFLPESMFVGKLGLLREDGVVKDDKMVVKVLEHGLIEGQGD